jgi:uncharacterized protein YneF (UPF0154 family)
MSQANAKSIFKILKASFQGGLIAAGINISWLFILEYSLKINGLPNGFPIAVVISSILPILIGAIVYYFLQRNFKEANRLFIFIGASFTALSLFPSFAATLPDGTQTPEYFALLTIPMHFIAGFVGLFYITQKS